MITVTKVGYVLERLAEIHAADPKRWVSLRELTGGSDEWIPPVMRNDPGRREFEAVRQAVRALSVRGRIETRYEWRTQSRRQSTPGGAIGRGDAALTRQRVRVTVARLAEVRP